MTQTTILAAIGELPQDVAVLDRALEVSTASRADLHVVHVLDLPGSSAQLDDLTTLPGQAAFAARDKIQAALTELGADLSSTKLHIVLGSHALALLDLCHDLSPDLIVMRAHQKVKISEKLLGSTTDRVIAAGHTPVLVVKRPVKHRYGRAVLATNGTDNALDRSAFVSNLLPEVKLHVVQAVQIPPQLKEAMLRFGSRTKDLTKHRRKLIEEAEDHLRDVKAQSHGRGMTSRVLKGDPLSVLTRMCRDQDFDLIALGQGRSSLVSRAFIGSVSRRLLRDAVCDVLIWCPKHGTIN
ncbi:nucleotide-binding universal stress UspA family protein [Litoreibacter halocynthiae]|uniref:Nucleotide-binding universal stress UspA family protein n=1 Tax=Litoreibacter halocynthiae TaxID=1242689 RepID=A0A4R7LPE2_9RHOB|nr:universal stress protein [Litoreibacter halocynthiae]TDT77978.1 nucleotide-binding universal stress UspA family protein [Litoreibacter halocynthiae]